MGDLGVPGRQLTLEVADPPEGFQQLKTKFHRGQAIRFFKGLYRASERTNAGQGNPQSADAARGFAPVTA